MQRFDLGLKAVVAISDAAAEFDPLTMQTRDISTNGVYLLTEAPLPIGTKIKVDMILPLDELKKTGGKALVKTSGKVLRSEPDGMAVCFDRNSKIVPLPSEKADGSI